MTVLELLMFLIAVAGVLRMLAQKWGVPPPRFAMETAESEDFLSCS